MSDIELPSEFRPCATSSPKKDTAREVIERLREEMSEMELASETIAQMENIPEPVFGKMNNENITL